MTRRPLVALATLAALTVGVLTPAPLASAQAAPAAQAPTVRLLARTPWVGEGVDFELSLQAAAVPDGTTARVQVHDRVRSRSEFVRSVDGAGLRTVQWVDGPRPVGGGSGPISFTVPLAEAPGRTTAPIDDPGVYPVEVDLFGPDGEEIATLVTHLVRLGPLDPGSDEVPLAVAVVAEVGGEPVDTGPLDADGDALDLPTRLTDTVDAIVAALRAHPDLPLNVTATPENLDALGRADPAAAADLAEVLAGSQLLAEPWVPVDEAAWQEADQALLAQLRSRGAATVDAELGRRPGSARLAGGASLASLRVAVADGAELLVVDDAELAPLDTGDFPYTLARPFELGLSAPAGSEVGEPDDGAGPTVPAVAADTGLAELAARAGDDPVLAAALVLADLAVIADDEPTSARTAVLHLPPVAAASTEFLSTLLGGLEPPEAPPAPPTPEPDPETGEVPEPAPPIPAAAPRVTASTLDDAVATVEPAGADGILATADDPGGPLVRRLESAGTVDDVGVLARRLSAARVDLESYRGVFGGGDPAIEHAAELLDTLAAEGLTNEVRADTLDSIDEHVESQLDALQAPELQRVSLTDREGLVQLVFTNDTGVPADVQLVMRADRLVLPDAPDGTMQVQLEPDVTRVELRVEARSSGDAPLDIQVTSPDGRLAVAETRVAVRTTAVSGVGIVLMVGALAFLAVWWTRTIVRERRSRPGPRHAHKRGAATTS